MIIGTFIDADRNFSEPWTSFMQFRISDGRPPNVISEVGAGLHKFNQPEGLIMCVQKVGNVKSSNGLSRKPKLDNARKLRGTYFIDPDDKEFKEIHFKKKKKTHGKVGTSNGSRHALQAEDVPAQ